MIELDYPAIGRRIAGFRAEQGIIASDLAEKVGGGLTRDVLAKIETGKRANLDIGMLASIAVTLDVPLVAILFDLLNPHSPVRVDGRHQPTLNVLAKLQGWESPRRDPSATRTILRTLEAYETRATSLAYLRLSLAEADPAVDPDYERIGFRANDVEREMALLAGQLRAMGVTTGEPGMEWLHSYSD